MIILLKYYIIPIPLFNIFMPQPDKEFQEIILAAKNGDMQAFEKILTLYEKRIFGHLIRITGQREDAEGLTQITFLKLYKYLKSINIEKNFNAWLYKIATNTAYDWLRKKKSHPELFIEDTNAIETMGDENAYDMVEGIESKEIVEEAINKIKPTYKSILLLFYREELTYQEISDSLSIPVNTVKSHLFRAKKSLKDQLISKI